GHGDGRAQGKRERRGDADRKNSLRQREYQHPDGAGTRTHADGDHCREPALQPTLALELGRLRAVRVIAVFVVRVVMTMSTITLMMIVMVVMGGMMSFMPARPGREQGAAFS